MVVLKMSTIVTSNDLVSNAGMLSYGAICAATLLRAHRKRTTRDGE